MTDARTALIRHTVACQRCRTPNLSATCADGARLRAAAQSSAPPRPPRAEPQIDGQMSMFDGEPAAAVDEHQADEADEHQTGEPGHAGT